jgi:hypothetical protein
MSPGFVPADRAMRAVQVGIGLGSSRSGRVKWCHEKRCLVTIAARRCGPSPARDRTACRKFDDKGVRGKQKLRCAGLGLKLASLQSFELTLPAHGKSNQHMGRRATLPANIRNLRSFIERAVAVPPRSDKFAGARTAHLANAQCVAFSPPSWLSIIGTFKMQICILRVPFPRLGAGQKRHMRRFWGIPVA